VCEQASENQQKGDYHTTHKAKEKRTAFSIIKQIECVKIFVNFSVSGLLLL